MRHRWPYGTTQRSPDKTDLRSSPICLYSTCTIEATVGEHILYYANYEKRARKRVRDVERLEDRHRRVMAWCAYEARRVKQYRRRRKRITRRGTSFRLASGKDICSDADGGSQTNAGVQTALNISTMPKTRS